MSKQTSEVELRLSAKDEATGVFKKVSQEFQKLSDVARNSGITGDNGIVGMLKGAGVAAAGVFASQAIESVAVATKQWAEGSLTAASALYKAAEGIPILGSILSATTSVAQAFDAVLSKVDGTADALKRAKDASDSFHESIRRRQGQAKWTDYLEKLIGSPGKSAQNYLRIAGLSGAALNYELAKIAQEQTEEDLVKQRKAYTAEFKVPYRDVLRGTVRPGLQAFLHGREKEAMEKAMEIEAQEKAAAGKVERARLAARQEQWEKQRESDEAVRKSKEAMAKLWTEPFKWVAESAEAMVKGSSKRAGKASWGRANEERKRDTQYLQQALQELRKPAQLPDLEDNRYYTGFTALRREQMQNDQIRETRNLIDALKGNREAVDELVQTMRERDTSNAAEGVWRSL